MTPINFSNLEKYSKTISDGSDKVNQALAEIEEKLNSLNLGVEARLESESFRVTLSFGGRPTENLSVREYNIAMNKIDVLGIGYGKDAEGQWGLLVLRKASERRAEDGSDDVLLGQTSRLLDASRDIRIGALDLIPLLLEKLEGKAAELVETISNATTSADKL